MLKKPSLEIYAGASLPRPILISAKDLLALKQVVGSDVIRGLSSISSKPLRRCLKKRIPCVVALPTQVPCDLENLLNSESRLSETSKACLTKNQEHATEDNHFTLYTLTFAGDRFALTLLSNGTADQLLDVTIENYRRLIETQVTAQSTTQDQMRTLEAPSMKQHTKRGRSRLTKILGLIGLGLASAYLGEELPNAPNNQVVETCENRLSDAEEVLVASLVVQDKNGRSVHDNILSPYKTSHYLLGGKFWYTGSSEECRDERVHRFALIGRSSGYLDQNGSGAERFTSTTLADAINLLLIDVPKLSDEEIKKWIIFTYRQSFGIGNLELERLSIHRDPATRNVTNVTYKPQDGFQKNFVITIPKEIAGVSAHSFQGNLTSDKIYVPLLGEGNRLLLQSGLSPNHDLRVPSKLLFRNKDIDLTFEGYRWQMRSNILAEELRNYSKISEEKVCGNRISPHVLSNSELMRKLTEAIIKNAKSPTTKIDRITNFVQALPYLTENAADFNRPPILTLFNGGGDCNNKTILWSSLMTTAGLDHAIIHVGAKDLSTASHVLGGVPISSYKVNRVKKPQTYSWLTYAPAEYEEPQPMWAFKDHYYVELTTPRRIGEKPQDLSKVEGAEILRKVNGVWGSEFVKNQK